MPDTCTGAFTDAFSPVAKRLEDKGADKTGKNTGRCADGQRQNDLACGIKGKGSHQAGDGRGRAGRVVHNAEQGRGDTGQVPPPRKSEA